MAILSFHTIVAHFSHGYKALDNPRINLFIQADPEKKVMLIIVWQIFLPVSRCPLHSTKLYEEKNMNKTAAVVSACVMAFTLSACSGPNYVMHTNDGRSIVSEGKPQTDNDTGMIKYTDANGNKQQINHSDVKEMVELER